MKAGGIVLKELCEIAARIRRTDVRRINELQRDGLPQNLNRITFSELLGMDAAHPDITME
jgi:hypothetical protein